MNVSRMAEFIRSLRESKNLTQEQLGDMINVSRSLISKWETGSKIPAVDCLTALAKVFDITVDEIIYGERKNNANAKEIETLSATIMNDSKKRDDMNHKIFFCVVMFLLFLILAIYFIFNYNSIRVYSVGAQGDNFDIRNTLMIISKNKSYIKFGDIFDSNGDATAYERYEFYAKDNDKKIVLSSRKDWEIVRNLDDNDNFLNFNNLSKFIDDLYVDIYYQDKVETIKLNCNLEMANNQFLNINKNNSSNIEMTSNMKDTRNLPKFVSRNFTYDEESDSYKYSEIINNIDVTFIYHYDIKSIDIFYENNKLIYDYKTNYLLYFDTTQEKPNKIYMYDLINDMCLYGKCEKYESTTKNFKGNYYKMLKN